MFAIILFVLEETTKYYLRCKIKFIILPTLSYYLTYRDPRFSWWKI